MLFARLRLAARSLRPAVLALELCTEARARKLVEPERAEHLAQDLVRRHVAVLERLDLRRDLRFDEAAQRIADHLVLLTPLDHQAASGAPRRNVISVISAGANRRSGGPQKPVPRET